MKVNRKSLLQVLESVAPGLAAKENIEQSTCFVFHDGHVLTFNDEVACSRKSPLETTGAVRAKPLLDLLSKLSEDEIDVDVSSNKITIKGQRKKSEIRMESEVLLPVEAIERPKKDQWKELHPDFSEAVNIVHNCASKEESEFVLTCVHLDSGCVEATDRFQIARYPIELNVNGSVLVRASSIKSVVGFDMTEIAQTDSWVHFRNPAGLLLSCRQYVEEYKNLAPFLSIEGLKSLTLPGGLDEVISRARIFSEDNLAGNHVSIELSEGRVVIQGEGVTGSHKEMKAINYSGEPMKFRVAPDLLVEISKKGNECKIDENRLVVDTGKFRYATCLEAPNEQEEGSE